MVSTEEILAAEKALEASQSRLGTSDEKLDDVMLAMDVVDTLRHERLMVEKELSSDDRREALIARLRDIYAAQGITVPDEVLMDGVLALEEQRFVFEPPKKSFGTWLAKIYINRGKWGPLVLTALTIIFSALAINHFAFERPARLEAKRVEALMGQEFPDRIEKAFTAAQTAAATDELRARADDLRSVAMSAVSSGIVGKAEQETEALERFSTALGQVYTVRVVFKDGRDTGIIRDNDRSTNNIRNYYIIVEAVSPSGEIVDVRVSSEELNETRLTRSWGVRVSKRDFDRIINDKLDDFIVQNADVGRKRLGYLEPEYSIETDGGAILDWD